MKKGNKAMSDMPDEIYAWTTQRNNQAFLCSKSWSAKDEAKDAGMTSSKYTRTDIHEKAVAERDALKAENERLREALKRLTAEAKLDGLHEKAGWDCWIMEAEKALQGGDEIAHERGEG